MSRHSDELARNQKASALQETLVKMLGCGAGSYAPLDEARATVLIRANCLARGHSGVRESVVDALLRSAAQLPDGPKLDGIGRTSF